MDGFVSGGYVAARLSFPDSWYTVQPRADRWAIGNDDN